VFSEDAINFLKKRDTNSERLNGVKFEENPIIGIISPEWYYSDSIRILHERNIDWDSIEKLKEVKQVSKNLKTFDDKGSYLPDFEKNFAGWYQPYHFLPRDKWGIHIVYGKWLQTATNILRLFQNESNIDINVSRRAFLYLYYHFIFHHVIENAVTTIEIISRSYNLYKQYVKTIYCGYFNSSKCLEESLANSFLFQKSIECHIDKDFLNANLMMQGNGYREFTYFLGNNFRLGIRTLLSQITQGRLQPTLDEPIEQVIDLNNQFSNSNSFNIPIWVHYRAKPLYQKNMF
jgi:hypothetical protein